MTDPEERERKTDRQTDRRIQRHTDREIYIQINRHTDRCTDPERPKRQIDI